MSREQLKLCTTSCLTTSLTTTHLHDNPVQQTVSLLNATLVVDCHLHDFSFLCFNLFRFSYTLRTKDGNFVDLGDPSALQDRIPWSSFADMCTCVQALFRVTFCFLCVLCVLCDSWIKLKHLNICKHPSVTLTTSLFLSRCCLSFSTSSIAWN